MGASVRIAASFVALGTGAVGELARSASAMRVLAEPQHSADFIEGVMAPGNVGFLLFTAPMHRRRRGGEVGGPPPLNHNALFQLAAEEWGAKVEFGEVRTRWAQGEGHDLAADTGCDDASGLKWDTACVAMLKTCSKGRHQHVTTLADAQLPASVDGWLDVFAAKHREDTDALRDLVVAAQPRADWTAFEEDPVP
eukprot:TRINITY_DN44752_c0_g1_i1.p1 TRINITY_DN44752_c0_g1~~TRINITY_DN44752_c0_g1_i1.p1  ORF type:complete len:195 (-),score=29.63 TRINITY_DN44752_c0_g1_i1:97-681(-)